MDVCESYQAAASRELGEELGVHVAARFMFKFLCQGEIGPYWLGVQEAVITGDVAPDPREVAWLGWMTMRELRHAVQHRRFIPDGQEVFERYLALQ